METRVDSSQIGGARGQGLVAIGDRCVVVVVAVIVGVVVVSGVGGAVAGALSLCGCCWLSLCRTKRSVVRGAWCVVQDLTPRRVPVDGAVRGCQPISRSNKARHLHSARAAHYATTDSSPSRKIFSDFCIILCISSS